MLSQHEIDSFHNQGYLITRGLIRVRELELLTEAVDAVKAEGVARLGEEHRYALGPDGREVYWRSEQMWRRGAIFQAATVNPDLLENIGQCIGHTFYPWNDSLVVKMPFSGAEVKWHQDPPYRDRDRESTFAVPNFTTDIYLDHSDLDNGCIYAIPGHHLVGNVALSARSSEELFARAVPLEMEAGDVLFHCLSTPHGSQANLTATQRRVLYVHYLADEVYKDGYAAEPWAAEKPGIGPERIALIDSMVEAREELGLESPLPRPRLRFDSEGIRFDGNPATPPNHWATLAAAIPSERRAALKALN